MAKKAKMLCGGSTDGYESRKREGRATAVEVMRQVLSAAERSVALTEERCAGLTGSDNLQMRVASIVNGGWTLATADEARTYKGTTAKVNTLMYYPLEDGTFDIVRATFDVGITSSEGGHDGRDWHVKVMVSFKFADSDAFYKLPDSKTVVKRASAKCQEAGCPPFNFQGDVLGNIYDGSTKTDPVEILKALRSVRAYLAERVLGSSREAFVEVRAREQWNTDIEVAQNEYTGEAIRIAKSPRTAVSLSDTIL
jgi:hypothetical protein